MIQEISPQETLANTRAFFSLKGNENSILDQTLLASMVRRAGTIFCPCSPSLLCSEVMKSLNGLTSDNDEELSDRIENVIDSLVAIGDFLEFNQVTIDNNSEAKGTWLFVAPPSFMVRSTGTVFIFGMTPQENSPLPEFLSSRLKYHECLRYINPDNDEDLRSILVSLGLLKISEEVWLKAPKQETAESFVQSMTNRLMTQPNSGEIIDLMVIDGDRPSNYYKGRWSEPRDKTGTYVGRRPQQYGSPIWCLVNLVNGQSQKFIDLPLKASRWRGCDCAWHLQMALDAVKGEPQRYRLTKDQNGARLDFFSPLPMWAQRRLTIIGHSIPREKSLMSFWVSNAYLQEEECYLQNNLWMLKVV